MRRLLIFCALIALSVFSAVHIGKATSSSTWTTPGNLQASEVETITEGILPTQYMGSIPCNLGPTKVRVVKKYLNFIPVLSQEYRDACSVPTAFGSVSSQYIQINGHDGAFQKNLDSTRVIPVLYTNNVFIVSTSGYSTGGVLYLNDHFLDSIQISPSTPDKLTVSSYGKRLVDQNGSPLIIDQDSVSISGDKQWLFANLVNGKQVRVSTTNTNEPPTIFGDKIDYFLGYDPQTKTAISDDGNYVAVGTQSTHLSLYSVEDCKTGSSLCRKNIGNQLTGIAGAGYKNMRFKFSGNDRFQIYLNGTYGGPQRKTKVYNFFSNKDAQDKYAQDSLPKYLAMGDSFASGEGAYNYRDGTDMPDNRCHQSLLAYSRLSASEVGISNSQSIACSGAKMEDVLYNGPKNYNEKKRQSKGLEDDSFTPYILRNFLPGYRQQIKQVSNYKPNTVTISISGNDIGFSDKIQTCLLTSWTCYDRAKDRVGMLTEIKNQYEPLKERLRKTKESAQEGAKVYVLGYPRFFPEDGGENCQANTPFDMQERRLANDLVHDLNQMIKLASKSEGVSYIDVETAMHGHYLCDSNQPAFNGLTAGNDAVKYIGYPLGRESFHPNQLGHQLMKDALLAQSDNLNKKNPTPDTSVKVDDFSSELTGQLSSNDLAGADSLPILVNNSTMTADSYNLQTDSRLDINLPNDSNRLLPNTNYRVEVHSTPTVLGTIKSGPDGSLEGRASFTQNLPTGFHEVHIIGPTHDGKTVDFYKSIFVVQTQADRDNLCAGAPRAGVDYDQDGVDDACDGYIGEPPAPEVPNPEIPAPELPTLQDPKTPLGESVAGLEELVPQAPSSPRATSPQQLAVATASTNSRPQSTGGATTLPQAVATTAPQQVLAQNNAVLSNSPAQTPDTPKAQGSQTPTASINKPIFVAGAIVVAIVLIGATQLKKD